MNIIQIFGHLGRDPETRTTPSGQKVTSFSVATNRRKAGKDETVWWNVTVWGDHKLIQYLKKGSGVVIVGTLDPRLYEKDGAQRLSLDVTAEMISFLPSSSKGERTQDASQSPQGASQAFQSYGRESSPMQSPSFGMGNEVDDDVQMPF